MASRSTARGAAAVKRIAAAAVIAAALWFAVQGGEFTTWDLIAQRRERIALAQQNDSLRRVVDSLKVYAGKVEHDPATQERIAREVFGMVRGDKEILYRFTDSADTTP